MANLNRVFIMGRLTKDVELRHTPKGVAVADLDIAVNRIYSGEDGEKKEECTFISITLWARTAEIAQQYLHKGSPVFIEGRLQLDTWDDKQTGQKRSRLRVIGENLQLLQSVNRQDSDAVPPPRSSGSARPGSTASATRAPADEPDPSDIPFRSTTHREARQWRGKGRHGQSLF